MPYLYTPTQQQSPCRPERRRHGGEGKTVVFVGPSAATRASTTPAPSGTQKLTGHMGAAHGHRDSATQGRPFVPATGSPAPPFHGPSGHRPVGSGHGSPAGPAEFEVGPSQAVMMGPVRVDKTTQLRAARHQPQESTIQCCGDLLGGGRVRPRRVSRRERHGPARGRLREDRRRRRSRRRRCRPARP